MKRSTRWMIIIVYYTSQLLGLMAFSYNYSNGKFETTTGITLYSCLVSVLMFCSVPLLFRIQWKPRNANGPELHFKISAIMCLIRIIAVLITVLLNWSKRREFMTTIRDFQNARARLLRRFVISQKVQQYFEKSIRAKFFWGSITNIILFLSSYDILKNIFDTNSTIIVTGFCTLATVLNVIMAHYFYALLNVNVLLAVINEELKGILQTAAQLFKLQHLKQVKPGALITSCCKLADELDELAFIHYNLQNIGERINRMHGLQGACVVLNIYLNNISVLYMAYMSVQHEKLSQEYGILTVAIIMPIALLFYYMDLRDFLRNMLHFGDYLKETDDLLKNLQPCLPSLDVRFEKSPHKPKLIMSRGKQLNSKNTMKRSTRWMIVIVYYTSQLLGIVAFSYNYDTGKLKTTPGITLYSCLVSVLMFCSLPLLFRIQWKPRNANGPELHFKISVLMCLIRILAVLVTVLLNWSKRRDFIRTIRDFRRLRLKLLNKFPMSTKVRDYFEKSIRTKFYWGFMSNILVFIGSYDSVRGSFDLESPVIITGLGVMVTVLNILMTHYFFALLNVNALLAVVNEEVRRILNASSVLFKLQRLKQIKPGALITACCQLADDLDVLAMHHYRLQLIGDHINEMYELQGACVMLTIYMNNISVIYMSYMLVQHKDLSQELGILWTAVLVFVFLFFVYKDLHIFSENMLNFVDYVGKTAGLLKNRQPWLPTLDERFEKSLKDFSVQLALFPLDMKLLGLFQFNRSMSFATFGSTISNAIVLMQYDYKYSKD